MELDRHAVRLAFSLPSGMFGSPVESEKRAVSGIFLPCEQRRLAQRRGILVGVKLPSITTPLAWLARIPGCWPQSLFITSTVCSATDDGSSAKTAAGTRTHGKVRATVMDAVQRSLDRAHECLPDRISGAEQRVAEA